MKKPGNPHRRKKGQSASPTLEDLFHKYRGKCVYCGCTTVLGGSGSNMATRDHVLARARGGKQAGNLVLACAQCNQKKADGPASSMQAR